MTRCEIKGCNNESTIIYYGKEICGKCFGKHCEGKIDLKKIFKIGEK